MNIACELKASPLLYCCCSRSECTHILFYGVKSLVKIPRIPWNDDLLENKIKAHMICCIVGFFSGKYNSMYLVLNWWCHFFWNLIRSSGISRTNPSFFTSLMLQKLWRILFIWSLYWLDFLSDREKQGAFYIPSRGGDDQLTHRCIGCIYYQH